VCARARARVCVCMCVRDSYVRIIISCCQTTRHRTFVISEKIKYQWKCAGKQFQHMQKCILYFIYIYIYKRDMKLMYMYIYIYIYLSIQNQCYYRYIMVWTTSFSFPLSLYVSYMQISLIAIYLKSNISKLSSCTIINFRDFSQPLSSNM